MTHKSKAGRTAPLGNNISRSHKPKIVHEVLFPVFRRVLIRMQSDPYCLGRTDQELDLTFLTRKTYRSVRAILYLKGTRSRDKNFNVLTKMYNFGSK
jgi:hypothetical protein